jgi:hypothetical protein
VKEYDVVLAASVHESLIELEFEVRDELMYAIWDGLMQRDTRTAELVEGLMRRVIDGYFVDYRNLRDSETKSLDIRTGYLIVNIAPASKGFPD